MRGKTLTALLFAVLPAVAALHGCGSEDSTEGSPTPLRDQGTALSGGSCELVSDDAGPDGNVPLSVSPVASGLEVPWAIGFLPNGDLLVTERPGRIRRIAGG